MIIPSKFLKLEYNPATDILYVEWPDIYEFSSPELKFILGEVINTIRSYDVKKVLADSTKSVVTLDPAEYEMILDQFTKDLMDTRLERFARLTTGQGFREYAAGKVAEALQGICNVQNFNDKDEAINWLGS